MSWEEMGKHRYPCPCGKGEYEEISISDDWGGQRENHVMLCPECKEKYVYDLTVVHGHLGDEIRRGWVLKSVLEEERRYRENVEKKARELYFTKWKDTFKHTKSKKEIWQKLTLNGRYYPSLGTFYKHIKGYGREKLIEEINHYFTYSDLKRVFEVCKVEPDWKQLGVNEDDKKRFNPEQ